MLQKLDAQHLNRLALAEALANMSTDDFDMRNISRCICGHTLRMFGDRPLYFYGAWKSQLRAGATLLGLSLEQARELFVPANRAQTACDHYTHPQDAARTTGNRGKPGGTNDRQAQIGRCRRARGPQKPTLVRRKRSLKRRKPN